MSVVEENVLDAIHYILERNEFKFTEKQLSLADEFIIPYISELGIDPKEFNVKTVGAPRLVSDKRIIPVVIKYFAFIEDNMSLYEELKNENYLFYENHVIKYYALDRSLTGNFKRTNYMNLLLKYDGVISHFYNSLRGIEKTLKEKYCKEFSDIVNVDQTTLKVGYSEDDINHYNFLIRRNIELFGKEFLLKLSSKQREMINNININLSEEEALKIKELFTKYPEYTSKINITSELLKYFSVDEISLINNKDAILYEEASKKDLLTRMKKILSINPEFDCPLEFIRKEIFYCLTDEEIAGLTEEGKKEILSINIPEIENVIVKPIRKINKIVAKDNKRKALLEKNESQGSIKK